MTLLIITTAALNSKALRVKLNEKVSHLHAIKASIRERQNVSLLMKAHVESIKSRDVIISEGCTHNVVIATNFHTSSVRDDKNIRADIKSFT